MPSNTINLLPVRPDPKTLTTAVEALPFEDPSTAQPEDMNRILATLRNLQPELFCAGFVELEGEYYAPDVPRLVTKINTGLRPGTVPELLAYIVEYGLEGCPESFAAFMGTCLGQDDCVLVEEGLSKTPHIRLYVPSEVEDDPDASCYDGHTHVFVVMNKPPV